jgi:hypothetical protein
MLLVSAGYLLGIQHNSPHASISKPEPVLPMLPPILEKPGIPPTASGKPLDVHPQTFIGRERRRFTGRRAIVGSESQVTSVAAIEPANRRLSHQGKRGSKSEDPQRTRSRGHHNEHKGRSRSYLVCRPCRHLLRSAVSHQSRSSDERSDQRIRYRTARSVSLKGMHVRSPHDSSLLTWADKEVDSSMGCSMKIPAHPHDLAWRKSDCCGMKPRSSPMPPSGPAR